MEFLAQAEPLSLVMAAVWLFAAGMFPVGIMLGSECSACCCETPCDEENPCPDGKACVDGCCEDPCETTCDDENPCPEGKVCVGGCCVDACECCSISGEAWGNPAGPFFSVTEEGELDSGTECWECNYRIYRTRFSLLLWEPSMGWPPPSPWSIGPGYTPFPSGDFDWLPNWRDQFSECGPVIWVDFEYVDYALSTNLILGPGCTEPSGALYCDTTRNSWRVRFFDVDCGEDTLTEVGLEQVVANAEELSVNVLDQDYGASTVCGPCDPDLLGYLSDPSCTPFP